MEKRNIQSEIFVRLLGSQGLRYSEARPKNIESDLYNYHLKSLIKKGFVQKINSLYSLSNKGKAYLSSEELIKPDGQKSDLFKLGLHIILYREKNGNREILMQKRKRHPHYGMISFVSGPINKGEFPQQAAERILNEETGIRTSIKLLGFERKKFLNESGDVVGDFLYHICCGKLESEELLSETVHGENFWCDMDKAIALEKNKASKIKKEFEILNLIKENKNINSLHIFYDEEVQISDNL